MYSKLMRGGKFWLYTVMHVLDEVVELYSCHYFSFEENDLRIKILNYKSYKS